MRLGRTADPGLVEILNQDLWLVGKLLIKAESWVAALIWRGWSGPERGGARLGGRRQVNYKQRGCTRTRFWRVGGGLLSINNFWIPKITRKNCKAREYLVFILCASCPISVCMIYHVWNCVSANKYHVMIVNWPRIFNTFIIWFAITCQR